MQRIALVPRSVVVLVVVSLASGCLVPGTMSGPAENGFSSNKVVDNRVAAKEVENARRTLDGGRVTEAIPQLLNVLSAYPDSPAAVEARYWLGIAYYQASSFRDAINIFQEYLSLAPAGRYAADSKTYIEKISKEYAKQYPAPDEYNEEIAKLKQALQADPGNLGAQWNLADLLWRRGSYEEAARLYARIAADHPEYRRDSTLTSRVELLPNGDYVALTPVEVQRRADQAKPLLVFNTSSFKSGRDVITRLPHYYVVTGQIVNQGDSVLYGVEVNITIYGVGNVVFDTSTARIGRLNPGEVRAFSVRFSNFDNIDSVERYECVGTFQQ